MVLLVTSNFFKKYIIFDKNRYIIIENLAKDFVHRNICMRGWNFSNGVPPILAFGRTLKIRYSKSSHSVVSHSVDFALV